MILRPATPPCPDAPRSFAVLAAMTQAELRAALTDPAWLAVAASYGLVEAQVMLGQKLLDGCGMGRDAVAARRWFAAAASADYPPALNMEGRCHELGWGGAVDLVRAAALYLRAAEAGLDWAQFNMAGMLLRGAGVAADRAAALRWYRRAAEQGHAKALNMVGRFLELGWETAPDPDGALRCYARAAEGGDFRGQFNLATLLAQHGRHTEALQWLHRALAAGSADFLREAGTALVEHADPAYRALGRAALRRAG